MISRRAFLGSAPLAVGAAAMSCTREEAPEPTWARDAVLKRSSSRVAVLDAPSYEAPLEDIVLSGLRACGIDTRGRRILVKPNIVEAQPVDVVGTSPRLVAAVVEALLRSGAREVVVGEGSGHNRDTERLLRLSGQADALSAVGARFVDLNLDDVSRVPVRSTFTGLPYLYLPRTLVQADLVVSLAKMKTHHWAGVTLSLKNFFGVMPGSVYGWPKNVLHWRGIPNSIIDINAAISAPTLAIVDGIIGMEGDGPLAGQPVESGVIVMGEDRVAVDATCSRLMSIDPESIGYLGQLGRFLGNFEEERIVLAGEPMEPFRKDYRVLEHFEFLKAGRYSLGTSG